MYQIFISREALKELKNLPKTIVLKISSAIEGLSSEPRPSACKKLKGIQPALWRIRVGDYRIIYQIDDTVRIIEVRRIGHRLDIYE